MTRHLGHLRRKNEVGISWVGWSKPYGFSRYSFCECIAIDAMYIMNHILSKPLDQNSGDISAEFCKRVDQQLEGVESVVIGLGWYSNKSLNERYPWCNYDEKIFNQTANECHCTALEDSRSGIFNCCKWPDSFFL